MGVFVRSCWPSWGIAGDALNPFVIFFCSANLVPEAPASVDAQEAMPTAEQVEVAAVEEAASNPSAEEAEATIVGGKVAETEVA